MEYIDEMKTTIRKLKIEIKDKDKRHLDVKKRLWDDFKKENKKL